MTKQLLTAASLCMVFTVLPLAAQAPATANGEEKQLLALVKELQAQQSQITDNQGKIESKVTEVTETIRIARIYSSRSGK